MTLWIKLSLKEMGTLIGMPSVFLQDRCSKNFDITVLNQQRTVPVSFDMVHLVGAGGRSFLTTTRFGLAGGSVLTLGRVNPQITKVFQRSVDHGKCNQESHVRRVKYQDDCN